MGTGVVRRGFRRWDNGVAVDDGRSWVGIPTFDS